MSRKIKSVFLNTLFVSLCLLTFSASLYFFFTDLNSTTVRSDKEIATIQFKKKIAQRKFSDSVVWERLSNNSPLYNEDIIRTESESQATMTFEKGAVIDLDEKSMIQIFEGKDGELKISVSGGNFTVDTTEAASVVKIDLGNGTLVNLEKGSRLSASNDKGESAIVISNGTGTILDEEGNEEVILSGSSVKIDSEGSRVKIPVCVKNMDSTLRLVVFEGQEKNVDFEFAVEDAVKDKPVYFEISDSADFEVIKEKISVADNELSLNVKKGVYYYRVYAENYFDLAQTGKVLVDENKNARLVSPNNDAVIESVAAVSDVSFIWNSGVHSDFSRIEIYDSNDVVNPIISKDVHDSSVKIEGLSKGKYFWKIIPHYSINEIGFKDNVETRTFEITRPEINPVPELSVPPMGANIVLGEEDKNILFACKSDIKTSDVRFEISTKKDFSSGIIYSELSDSQKQSIPLNIVKVPQGKYFWRVVTIDENKKEYFSSVRDFSVTKFVPKTTQLVFPPENYSVDISRIDGTQFIWSLSDNMEKSKVQSVIEISGDRNFSSLVKAIKCPGISYSGISIPEGNYFWRVRALSLENNSEIAKTDGRKLVVLKPLDSPDILSPEMNSQNAMFAGSYINVSWKRISEADYYNVKIIEEKSGKVLENFKEVKQNSVSAKLPVNKKYKVAVTALTEEKENSPARKSVNAESVFSISELTKIVLSYPANNQRIDGLSAVRKNVTFKWNAGTSAINKEFVLYKLNADGTSKVIHSQKTKDDSFSVRRLAPGKYRWIVKASTSDGKNLTPDAGYEFTVTDIASLANVKLVSPQNKFVIDIPYLKNNRSVTYSWKAVTGATDYEFSLYQKNENGTLKKIISEKVKDTSYTVSDLSRFDVGNFEWHVTALCLAGDGFEEQRSKDSVFDFEINMDIPQTVKTKTPGKMYAE